MSDTVPGVTLVRRLRAAPAEVFAAWVRPEILATWFGPHRTRVALAEVDARVGGHFRIVLLEQDGAQHEVGGTFIEVTPGAGLSFTWAWRSAPERQSRVTLRLRAIPEGTELTLVHDRLADAETARRHENGWTQTLERLGGRFVMAA